MAPQPRAVLVWLPILAGAYFVAGKLGLQLAFVHPSATAVWPPSGIGLAAVLVLGHRIWPGIFAGAFLVNITTAGTVLTSIGIATGNTLESVVGALLVNRFARGAQAFERPADVFRFAALAGLLATTVSATLGLTSLALGGFAPWAEYARIWQTWWLGDVVGVIVVAPLLVLLSRAPRVRWDRARVLEAALVVAALVLAAELAVGSVVRRDQPLTFLSVVPLVWAAMRLGTLEASAANALLSGLALTSILAGGPVVAESAHRGILFLQAFLTVPAVMALAIAAAMTERETIEESRRRTAESRSQVALTEREQRFAKLFQATPVAMSLSTLADGRLLDVNDRWCDLTGYSREEAIGQAKEDLGIWVEPVQRGKLVAQLRAYGSVPETEILVRTRRGLLRRVLAKVERIEIDRQDCMLLLLLRT